MILVTRNWRMYFIGLAVSIGIFLVIYFTAIRPSVDTANQAVKSGLQQSQQALNQAQKQINSTGGASGAAGSAANTQINKAVTLTKCVAAAGTDVGKVQACQAKYGG